MTQGLGPEIDALLKGLGTTEAPAARVLRPGESVSAEEVERIAARVRERVEHVNLVQVFAWLISIAKAERIRNALSAIGS